MKLTKAMTACLEAMLDSHNGVSIYEAIQLGGNGRTMSALVERGFATWTRYAGGKLWTATDLGRKALAHEAERPASIRARIARSGHE